MNTNEKVQFFSSMNSCTDSNQQSCYYYVLCLFFLWRFNLKNTCPTKINIFSKYFHNVSVLFTVKTDFFLKISLVIDGYHSAMAFHTAQQSLQYYAPFPGLWCFCHSWLWYWGSFLPGHRTSPRRKWPEALYKK